MSCDCEEKAFVVLPYLAVTTLSPDLLFSKKYKRVILIELTCPCKENMEARYSDKFHKYNSLCSEISIKGWQVDYFAVEMGARGYCAESLRFCFRALCFQTKVTKSALKQPSLVLV